MDEQERGRDWRGAVLAAGARFGLRRRRRTAAMGDEKKLLANWYLIGTAASVTAVIVLGLAGVGWLTGADLKTVIELVRALLSWPVAMLAIAALLFYGQHDAMDEFIRTIIKVKWGTGEIQRQKVATASDVASANQIATAEAAKTDPRLQDLRDNLALSEEERAALENLTRSAMKDAILWKLQFCDQYFAPRTKFTLRWLDTLPESIHQSLYDQLMIPLVPDPRERQAVTDTSLLYEMVKLEDERYKITSEGEALVLFWGLPPVTSAPGFASLQ